MSNRAQIAGLVGCILAVVAAMLHLGLLAFSRAPVSSAGSDAGGTVLVWAADLAALAIGLLGLRVVLPIRKPPPPMASNDHRRIFRSVELPDSIAGRLLLSRTPSRVEPFARELEEANVALILCLRAWSAEESGVREYVKAIVEGRLPCPIELFPIRDFGIPADLDRFVADARRWAGVLSQGSTLLVHCGAGIGRTGMVACCILIALGIDPTEARRLVNNAGSGPETREQDAFVSTFADTIKGS